MGTLAKTERAGQYEESTKKPAHGPRGRYVETMGNVKKVYFPASKHRYVGITGGALVNEVLHVENSYQELKHLRYCADSKLQGVSLSITISTFVRYKTSLQHQCEAFFSTYSHGTIHEARRGRRSNGRRARRLCTPGECQRGVGEVETCHGEVVFAETQGETYKRRNLHRVR